MSSTTDCKSILSPYHQSGCILGVTVKVNILSHRKRLTEEFCENWTGVMSRRVSHPQLLVSGKEMSTPLRHSLSNSPNRSKWVNQPTASTSIGRSEDRGLIRRDDTNGNASSHLLLSVTLTPEVRFEPGAGPRPRRRMTDLLNSVLSRPRNLKSKK